MSKNWRAVINGRRYAAINVFLVPLLINTDEVIQKQKLNGKII